MTCSHCPHCKAIAARSSLRLPDPPSNRGRAGMDFGFYTAFGRAYDRARALGPQPMRRLQDVNPWLTASQCRSYLKRARTLGVVESPSRDVPTVEPPAPVRPGSRRRGRRGQAAQVTQVTELDPDMDLLSVVSDDAVWTNWDRKGQPVTAAQVVAAASVKLSESAAQGLIDRAIRDGFVHADSRLDGAFRQEEAHASS